MKVLVTGGAGFIGSHVVKQLLDEGHSVVVYDDLSRGYESLIDHRALFVRGSVLDKAALAEALEGVDAVIHMAAFIIVPESVKKPKMYWENNVGGTKVLLEAMSDKGVKKLIFSSSATVYGEPDKLPLTEESPLKKPTNPYGETKLEMEQLCQNWARAGKDLVILRYFNPYGPNELHNPETHAIPNFVKATLKKEPIPLYWKGEQIRDFIYVEDLAKAHIDTLNTSSAQVFNIGTEVGTKVKDVVNTIFKIAGYSVPMKDLGVRPGDAKATYASSEKLKKSTGWTPKNNLETGLRKTVEFFRDNLGR